MIPIKKVINKQVYYFPPNIYRTIFTEIMFLSKGKSTEVVLLNTDNRFYINTSIKKCVRLANSLSEDLLTTFLESGCTMSMLFENSKCFSK